MPFGGQGLRVESLPLRVLGLGFRGLEFTVKGLGCF